MTYIIKKHQLALLSLLAFALLPFSTSYAGLYKWTDENGKVHYGDRPPPVNDKYGHEVLNSRGSSIAAVEREQTDEERSEARRAALELAEETRNQNNLARIDRLLLSSFPSFNTLEAARADRLSTLDDSIAYLHSRKDVLNEKRETNSTRVRHFRRKNLEVPNELSTEASNIKQAIEQIDAQIAEMQTDRTNTVQEFKTYKERLGRILNK